MGYWSGTTKRAYHHTAPINALYGLHESLVILQEEGLENAWARHQKNHLALRAGLEAMGLKFVVPEAERLPQLNAISVPEGVDEALVRSILLSDYDLEIGAGLGAMAGKVWRVGLMGHASNPRNVRLCLNALDDALGRLKRTDHARCRGGCGKPETGRLIHCMAHKKTIPGGWISICASEIRYGDKIKIRGKLLPGRQRPQAPTPAILYCVSRGNP